MSKIITLVLVVMIIFNIIIWSSIIYALVSNRYEPMSATEKIEFNIEIVERPYNWREKLDDIFKTLHFTHYRDLTKSGCAGQTILIFRIVYMHNKLTKDMEAFTYAHELTHLKYFTKNETFTEYNTIIELYESNEPYFKYLALKFANGIINYNWFKNTKYDCGLYLQKYFNKIKKI